MPDSIFLVSIPKGAIEGRLPHQPPRRGNVFQYQKVRLKVHRHSKAANQAASFNTKRCDWRKKYTLPQSAHVEFQYQKVRLKADWTYRHGDGNWGFNTKRCDWRFRTKWTLILTQPVSIPKGAIEGAIKAFGNANASVFQYQKVRLKDSATKPNASSPPCFNTKRCDWRLNGLRGQNGERTVSIPKGAIEGERSL